MESQCLEVYGLGEAFDVEDALLTASDGTRVALSRHGTGLRTKLNS